jgi:plasmid stability protein
MHFAYIAVMTVTFSIRDVPDDLAERLRLRAKRNHRSVQGELMAILESAGAEQSAFYEERREFRSQEPQRKLTIEEVSQRVRKLGLPRRSESTQMIREDRDDPNRP